MGGKEAGTVRCAVVGLGRWGRVLMQSVRDSERIRFVAGVSSRPHPDLEQERIAIFPTLQEAIRSMAIDAVVIASPHSAHPADVRAACEAGKHVFVEKPLALTLAEARASIEDARRAGVILAVGHNRRFLKAHEQLKTAIAEGRLGKLMHVEGAVAGPGMLAFKPDSWRSSRTESPLGGFTGMGVHLLDTMIDLCGEVAAVSAQSSRSIIHIDIDDTTSLLLRFRSKMTGYLGCVAASAPLFSVRLFGADATAELLVRSWGVRRGRASLTIADRTEELHLSEPVHIDIERAELESFGDSILTGKPYRVDRPSVLNNVAAMQAAEHSAGRNGEWTDVQR